MIKRIIKFLKDLWDAELTLLFLVYAFTVIFVANFVVKIEFLIGLIRGESLEEMVTFTVKFAEERTGKKYNSSKETKFVYDAILWPIKLD